jgi:D-aspartate ligase
MQEFIPGDDTAGANYNSFFVRGEPRVEVTARKVRLSPPRTGFPRVVVSKHIPELLAPGRKMLEALGFDGFSCMEFKKDARNGVYVLMEINGRLNLSTPLSVKAGINFPYLAYRYALSSELPEVTNNYAEDIYWIDIGRDIVESFRNCRTEHISLAGYLGPYVKSHVFTLLSAGDPLPFFKRCRDIVYALIQRFFDKSRAITGVIRSRR